jgi:ribonuclease P/MRP protein subunit RPP1
MIATDGLVHPYPNGDSSLRRMALEARELGFDSIVATEWDHCDGVPGIVVTPGVLISANTVRGVISQLKRTGDANSLVLVNAGDNAFNRSVLSLKGIHILRNLHTTHKHSFDHITGRMAAEKGVAVDLDLRPLIHLRGNIRQKVLYRYQDLVRLQDRFGFPLTLSSNALSVLDQRSVRDMMHLTALFGLDKGRAGEALGTIGRLLSPERAVRVVG